MFVYRKMCICLRAHFKTRANEPLLTSSQPVWSVVFFNSQLTKVSDVNFTIFNKVVVLELF